MKDHPICIKNETRENIPPVQAKWCSSFFSRLRGYTFRKNLAPNEGLLLVEGRESRVDTSIHMLFVWTDLAVFWLDNEFKVVDKVLAKAWRPFYASAKPARYTLEIHPSRLKDFEIGEQVKIDHEK